jgi:hypothetical protein
MRACVEFWGGCGKCFGFGNVTGVANEEAAKKMPNINGIVFIVRLPFKVAIGFGFCGA